MPGWARWDRWSQWGQWAGGVVFFAISGQVNDASGAGLDGVTVTLTGDASDSVVTAGGGLYEFTGLNPGSYTVTPTKGGYTFSPLNAAVTIVGANKVATTMAAVWKIAGTILDGSSPIAGVTVALTGDASDSTTTDGSGDYEFTTLSDGNYTVTPTKVAHTFTPTSSAEAVSGADVDSDFVGTEWLWLDEFTTPDTAPIADPRTMEPGPGNLEVNQPSNQISVAGRNLVFADVAEYSGVANDTNLPAVVGNALYGKISSWTSGTTFQIGLDTNSDADGALDGLLMHLRDGLIFRVSSGLSGNIDIGRTYSYPMKPLMVLRGASGSGAFCVVNGDLVWVFDTIRNRLKQAIITHATAATVDKMGTLSLPDNGYTAFATQYGPATNRVASPSSGEIVTSEADSWNEFTWTVATGETLEWLVRRIDDTHAWIIRCDQAGSTIKIIEVNGGETERASAAMTWTDTNTYRVIVIADDESIKTFVDTTAKASYGSAAYNKTETGQKISGFAAGADFVNWPVNMVPLLPLGLV